ncbi:hypothetical protein THAOC_34557 [Thalassiosira oceanica]|uniref:Uncharacterized protein n=1 Tax=Thalassiosira oceanica TaxID=159749 RepID=K0R4T0_THAOC|nr:hypothetical protein THAOC_34557 [Thalassiosira oceanica]|eukprot:EJK46759.1 hypothetical protein THAOC_34557 [Thalassiosira oceanica]
MTMKLSIVLSLLALASSTTTVLAVRELQFQPTVESNLTNAGAGDGDTPETPTEPTTNAGTAPDAQYHDESWGDLPVDIKAAYEALGYSEDYWCNGGEEPAAGGKGWSGLNDEEQAAATVLGYDQESWDSSEEESPVAAVEPATNDEVSDPEPAPTAEDPAATETPDAAATDAAASDGSSSSTAPDAQYHDESWGDLPVDIKAAYEALGYSEDYWCNGGDEPAAGDKGWSELNAEEQAAATVLGYDQKSWDGSEEESPADSGKSTVAEPATNDEVAEPATNDEVAEPATNDEVAEPATNDEVAEPATNDEVSDPETASIAEDPAAPSSAKSLGVSSALGCIVMLYSFVAALS